MSNKKWKAVGEFLKENAAEGVGLVGSLLTGNIPGAIATGVSLVASATGTDNADEALAILSGDASARIRLKELALQEDELIRQHLREIKKMELEDEQHEHATTQSTIQAGDHAQDKFVRRTRPSMAIASLISGSVYALVANVPDPFILGLLLGPCVTYMGMRQISHWKNTDAMSKVAMARATGKVPSGG